jgi:DNA (cytosine-5)-methyltransferase 1
MTALTTVHLFAGGCGDLRGFDNAGFRGLYAANHAEAACDTARLNWRTLRVQQTDINNLDMRSLPAVDGLVGSPICTEVGPAGGQSAPKVQAEFDFDDDTEQQVKPADWSRTRMTAWDPIRYAEVHRPLFYAGENVPGFATRWPLFGAWLGVWDALGYNPVIASVNAAHIHGDGYDRLPQSRNRLVWAMVRKDLGRLPDLRPRPDAFCPNCGPVLGIQNWTTKPGVRKVGGYRKGYHYICPTPRCHVRVEPVTRGIGDVIDLAVRGSRFGDGWHNGKAFVPYEAATRRRVEIGLDRFGGKPFMVTLRNHGTATSLDAPIGTVTAQGGEHHYLVRPTADMTVDECEYRPLALAEKALAQGFPTHHLLAGTDAEQKLQIGNAVPVNVAQWLASRIHTALAAAA